MEPKEKKLSSKLKHNVPSKGQPTTKEYEAEIKNLRSKLVMSLDAAKKVDEKWGEKVQEVRDQVVGLEDKLARLKKKNKRLKKSLRGANYQIGRLVDANGDAASAAHSIARVTHSLGVCLDTLEMKVSNDEKERASRFRR